MQSISKTNYFCLSLRTYFCIVENENNIFDQRYMWNTLTIVGSCINLASGKLFVLSWRQNDKKSICFRHYRKTSFEIKRYDTKFIYNRISRNFYVQESLYIQLSVNNDNHRHSWYCFLRNRQCILMFRVLSSSCVVFSVFKGIQ